MIAALRRLPLLEAATLVAATLVLILAGVLRERERASAVTPDSFSSYDARSGGYRALYEMLEREGVHVERFARQPAFLRSSLDTLVWAEPLPFDPRQARMTRADAHAFEVWVRAGGRLLYIGHDDAAARRGLLHLPETRSPGVHGGALDVARSLRAAGVTRIFSSSPLRWRRSREYARVLVYDRFGAVALSYALGRGSVVAVVDEQLFANASIARGEQARLAYALARPIRRNGWVAFDEAVHGYAVPEHWWSIVPRPFAFALGIGGLALLVGFCGAALRLGPPLRQSARTDRSSAEFIDAMSALLERGEASATALHDAARSATRVVARALAAGEDTPADDIAARLENEAARADFQALLAAARNTAPDESDLIRGVARAQRLRKEFAPHGRSRY